MEDKKDIGKHFRDRIDESEADAPEILWERIDDTLERKKKQKKRFFWLILTTIGLVVTGVVYFGILHGDSEIMTSETDEPDSEERVTENRETTAEIETTSTTTTAEKEAEETEEEGEIVEKGTKTKQKTVLDSFTESETTYYYYRSSDEEKIITTDRSRVDSVIKEYKNRVEESDTILEPIPMKKKDS